MSGKSSPRQAREASIEELYFINGLIFSVYVCFACRSMCLVLKGARRGCWAPRTEIIESCKLWGMCWEVNVDPLQEQKGSLKHCTISPASEIFLITFYYTYVVHMLPRTLMYIAGYFLMTSVRLFSSWTLRTPITDLGMEHLRLSVKFSLPTVALLPGCLQCVLPRLIPQEHKGPWLH